MNFNIPPLKSLLIAEETNTTLIMSLCPGNYTRRCSFYEKILVPTGHAKGSTTTGWWFSEEYFMALQKDLPLLQAWLKLIL